MGSELYQQLASEYRSNLEGSYVIQTAYRIPKRRAVMSRCHRDVGMLINHSVTTPNLKLSRPLHVRGKWRLALRDIRPQEEVTYD